MQNFSFSAHNDQEKQIDRRHFTVIRQIRRQMQREHHFSAGGGEIDHIMNSYTVNLEMAFYMK